MTTTNNTNQNDRLTEAQNHVKQLREFYQSLTSYIVTCTFLALINWLTSPVYWWVLWVILGWGIAIVLKFVRLTKCGLWDSKWEQRKIEQYMRENK